MTELNRCVASRVLAFFVIASAAWLASASVSSAQSSSTDIGVSGSITQSTAARSGVTLGGEAWVDGGPLRKDLVVNNPGFEAADYRAILRCGTLTADGCRVADAAAAEPTGFWNGAHYQVMSGSEAGASGTVASHSSGVGGSVLSFDKNLSLSSGDYFAVQVLQPVSEIAGWAGSANGGGTITAETADLSPEASGKQAVLLSALRRGSSARLSQILGGQPVQSALKLNGAYEVSFLAKGAGGNNLLDVSVAREASGNPPYLDQRVALTDDWALYTLSFSATETGTQASELRLSFAAAGANVELDDVSLRQSDSSSANATAFRDEVVNALQDLHPPTIRMVSGGRDVLTQLANPFARYGQGQGSYVAPAPATASGIHEFLQLCAKVGANPWITLPASTTPAEMADLVQYLAGEGSDPWSGLRIARGQADPWTSVFRKIHIELENSTGTSGSASEPMASPAYASWSNAVFAAARLSSGYSAGKIDLISSGSAAIPPALTAPASSPAAETSAPQSAASIGQVFNCSSFASSGTCGVSFIYPLNQTFWVLGSTNGSTPALSGTQVNLVPTGATHIGLSMNYPAPVNVQAFTSTFTFVPNGYNLAFVVQNDTSSNGGGGGSKFSAGAGCEAGFYQAFYSSGTPPSNILAIELDQQSGTTNQNGSGYGSPYTYSTVQIYQQGQSPCNPNDNQPYYYYTQKISTSPVPMNAPYNNVGVPTGDTYSATVRYDGTNLTISVYDVTAGGSCPGSKCFSQTWSAVNIPSLVGSNTAYVGLTAGTNSASSYPLYINSFSYAVDSPPSSPSLSTYTSGAASGAPHVSNPTLSPSPGTYSGAQSVTLSSSTPGAYFCYTLSDSPPALMPQPNNYTSGCSIGTLYTGPIAVSSTQTLYAVAGAAFTAVVGLPSDVIAGAYTIGVAPTAATPAFSPVAGTYTSPQTVALSDSTSGATLYYTTNGITPTTSSTKYSGPITVASTETLKAIAVASGYANSAVATATYTINATPATPTFSVAGGTYASALTVSISDASSGATIYYTTNGTTPTTSSTKYSGAITVSSTETLEAVATLGDPTISSVASATYVIEPTFINYPSGGFTASSLDLNGGATIASGGLLQLTDGRGGEARSAWFATKVPVQTFTTDFTFDQLNAKADGLTFAIQGQGPAALGGVGGSLGYQRIADSVAVKFDLYNNDGEGIDSTGLYTGGAAPTVPSVDLSSTPINLRSGDVMRAHIVYDGTNLTMTLTDTVTGGSVTEVFPVNIPSLVGANTAYVGFTGGTGGETSTQNVLSWTYSAGASAPTAATPTFSVASGTYTSAQQVSISDATSGATIYYTTNGTTPTTSSTKYSGAITVSSTETLKAIATASGSTTSAAATASYVIELPSIDYASGGFTASSLALNGGAAIASGGLLELTDGGSNEGRSAWFATKVPVKTFTTDFAFQQLNANADGLTFAIQGQGPTALGGAGGSLGYQNIPASVAVKFDLYNNDGEGIDSTGLYTVGASPSVPSVDLASTAIKLRSGDVMHAHMVYDGTNLTMTLTDTATSGSVTEVFPVNIPGLVGANTAYVGFTGGTGGETSTQKILSWTYSTP